AHVPVLVGVDRLLVRAPVVAVAPVGDELAQVAAARPVAPVLVRDLGRPGDGLEPALEIVELRLRDLDREALGLHGVLRAEEASLSRVLWAAQLVDATAGLHRTRRASTPTQASRWNERGDPDSDRCAVAAQPRRLRSLRAAAVSIALDDWDDRVLVAGP